MKKRKIKKDGEGEERRNGMLSLLVVVKRILVTIKLKLQLI
jgi:hypothetical protein